MSEPNQAPPATAASGNAPRRRSSSWMPAFESLQQQKNSQDAARRQSMSDQQAKGGIFSQFFHKYVHPLGIRPLPPLL
ncbi:uncharacterized protein MAM_06813 [Metarhizium album ARSEF 1941]|uniref:Uncharacterized protein n=1 Tax=Metarhizium album (strain ARSEF 1941) TaxID=1081103 RepID=A0A0B2WNU7_METAS|nr:uncharacterized protein MAM_06813 [Metarhizium album ARSEF 1941]KHN95309.1 hypothetical protein MAM_06813 [Metarhizium album ARSEF 1941]